MQSRKSRSRHSGTQGRRKVALACEPCRTRKSRCDGIKPICGPCEKRGHSIEQCLYKTENARSASQDEYIRILHNRIRELEKACIKGGIPVPALGSGENESTPQAEDLHTGSPMQTSQTLEPALTKSPDSPTHQPRADPEVVSQFLPNIESTVENQVEAHQVTPGTGLNHKYSSLAQTHDGHTCSQLDPGSNVTAMGAISTVDNREASISPQDEYFGSSSSASLMRLLVRGRAFVHSVSSRAGNAQREESNSLPPRSHSSKWGGYSRFQLEGSVLPPRAFADHLLECFWERVYCLYPFFHRQSFEDAYENLWVPQNQPARQLSDLNIGIGSKIDSGPDSLVFNCALNIVFALGCHFADIPSPDREAVSYTFFLRSKQFVGLDFLEVRSIGVVQALLTTALYLQSTPYPDLCWNAIGVACRVAQGFGLHAAQLYETKNPLEQKIQRRTWHGCVIMDMIVSMTYGRPSMTSHLPEVPFLNAFDSITSQDPDQNPTLMTFYIETIRLYKILDIILSDVYHTWQGRSNKAGCSTNTAKQGGLDILITIEKELHEYEANLPSILSWTGNSSPTPVEGSSILKRQRNVLHARFLYLHLLLYRPTFTYVCSEEAGHQSAQGRSGNDTPGNRGSLRNSTLYSTISSKCAVECVKSAVELVSLVHDTCHTSATDTWWYNGFYTSTAAMVFIMSYSCRSVQKQLDEGLIDQAWGKCEKILGHMAVFSQSARNTLRFLKAAHAQTISNSGTSEDTECQENTCHTEPYNTQSNTTEAEHAGENTLFQAQEQVPLAGPLFTWGDAMDAGVAPDELGFLGPFDFTDVSSWFPDMAG